jgi:helicase
VSYALVTLVEQAVVVLEQLLSGADEPLSPVVARLPDFLRFGVSTVPARHLMAEGVRHRRAAVLLGADPSMQAPENLLASATEVARSLIEANPERWAAELGTFVFERTQRDLGIVTSQTQPRGGG